MTLELAEGGRMAGKSFDAWVRPHLVAMQRYAARLTTPADAEDVVQEALVRAWRRRSTYDASRGEPLPWLLAIVRDRARRTRLPAPAIAPPVQHSPQDLDLERAIALCAPGTVRATLHHARAALKEVLDDD